VTMLTAKEWQAWKGKFSWMRVHYEFQPIHTTIIEKWMSMHCQGWWYYEKESANQTLVCFEHSSEMVAFKIWVVDNSFDRDHGDVT
jgi:hypothetical protein